MNGGDDAAAGVGEVGVGFEGGLGVPPPPGPLGVHFQRPPRVKSDQVGVTQRESLVGRGDNKKPRRAINAYRQGILI